MAEDVKIVSKVLVHEVNESHMTALKEFFAQNNLIGLKADHYKNIHETLKSNIDLGAIFLCEEADRDGKGGIDMVMEIHKLRPELPIFLRRLHHDHLEDLDAAMQQAVAAAYQTGDREKLKQLIDRFLFNTYYPSSMIRGIEQISLDALHSIFHNTQVSCSTPYLIRDRLIYGKLFSIISLESNWCRGYMMLQAEERPMIRIIQQGRTGLSPKESDFRSVNSLMSEMTNMIWGTFKAKFFSSADKNVPHRTQVPIIIDHNRKYISFGSEDPQLCFHYVLQDLEKKRKPVSLYQKFVFNLHWAPQEFREAPEAVDNLVQSGELELF